MAAQPSPIHDRHAMEAAGAGNDGAEGVAEHLVSEDDAMKTPGRHLPAFVVLEDPATLSPDTDYGDSSEMDAHMADPELLGGSPAPSQSNSPFRSDLEEQQTMAEVDNDIENASVPPVPANSVMVPAAFYHADILLHNPDKPAKPYSPFPNAATDPTLSHLREISGLASWTVSSYKPGCGVAALLNPTTATFWQSDGPQPHLLSIHFFKLVRIVKFRVYLDFQHDESYTPTRLSFTAGTHEYDAVEFAEWRWADDGPKGWIDVDLSHCGSEEDHEMLGLDGGTSGGEAEPMSGVLKCFFLQIRVLENHQNGKDTHIRGVQIFARDERVKKVMRRTQEEHGDDKVEEIRQGLEEADWMGEPEIR